MFGVDVASSRGIVNQILFLKHINKITEAITHKIRHLSAAFRSFMNLAGTRIAVLKLMPDSVRLSLAPGVLYARTISAASRGLGHARDGLSISGSLWPLWTGRLKHTRAAATDGNCRVQDLLPK